MVIDNSAKLLFLALPLFFLVQGVGGFVLGGIGPKPGPTTNTELFCRVNF